jgi:hypothetical protein
MRRHLFLTFILMFYSWNAFAAIGAEKPMQNYRVNWVESKKSVTQMGGAQVTGQIRQRILLVHGVAIPVATIGSGEIKSATGEGFPQDLTGALQKITNMKSWKKEVRGNYTAYEGLLPEQGRLIKVFISKGKDSYKYSVATIRVAFMLPTYYEAEIIQREEIGDGAGVAALSDSGGKFASLYKLLLQPAYAAPTPSWLTSILGSWDNTVNTVGNTAAAGIASVNNVAGAGNNVALSGQALAGAGNNVANAITSAASQGSTTVNQAMISATNIGNRLSGSIDNASTTVNNPVNTMTNKTKMAKVAFAAGLGGALGYGLGTILVQMTMEHGLKLADEVYHMITGDLMPEVRDRITDQGKQAWAALKGLSEKTMELDLEMQKQLMAMYLAGGENPMSLGDVRDQIGLLEDKINDAQEAKKKNNDDNFRISCNRAINSMREQLELLKSVEPIMKKFKSPTAMCEGFDQMYDRWVDTESEINASRNIILNDTFALITDADRRQQDAAKVVASKRNVEKECNFSSQISAAKSAISSNKCICFSGLTAVFSGSCGSLCRTLDNYVETSKVCVNVGSKSQSLDPVARNEDVSEIALQTAKSLQRRQDQIANSDYNKTQAKMTTHFRDILDQCGSKTVVQVKGSESRGKQMAESVMKGNVPLSSAGPSGSPTPDNAPGFMKSMWETITNPSKWFS